MVNAFLSQTSKSGESIQQPEKLSSNDAPFGQFVANKTGLVSNVNTVSSNPDAVRAANAFVALIKSRDGANAVSATESIQQPVVNPSDGTTGSGPNISVPNNPPEVPHTNVDLVKDDVEGNKGPNSNLTPPSTPPNGEIDEDQVMKDLTTPDSRKGN